MTVLNQLDRCHLVIDVIDRVPGLGTKYAHVKQDMRDLLVEHHEYVCEHGDDLPSVRDWTWPYERA
jgi:xylulose-5-phosphate/fructose-6-phosphate phosphoketolase